MRAIDVGLAYTIKHQPPQLADLALWRAICVPAFALLASGRTC
jgi:hypothetical protein